MSSTCPPKQQCWSKQDIFQTSSNGWLSVPTHSCVLSDSANRYRWNNNHARRRSTVCQARADTLHTDVPVWPQSSMGWVLSAPFYR